MLVLTDNEVPHSLFRKRRGGVVNGEMHFLLTANALCSNRISSGTFRSSRRRSRNKFARGLNCNGAPGTSLTICRQQFCIDLKEVDPLTHVSLDVCQASI